MAETAAVTALPPPRDPARVPERLSPSRERLRAALTRAAVLSRDAGDIRKRADNIQRIIQLDERASQKLEQCQQADRARLAEWFASGATTGRPTAAAETIAAEEAARIANNDAVAARTLVASLEGQSQELARKQQPIIEEKLAALCEIMTSEVEPLALAQFDAAFQSLQTCDDRLRGLINLYQREGRTTEAQRLEERRRAPVQAMRPPADDGWARQIWDGLAGDPSFEIAP